MIMKYKLGEHLKVERSVYDHHGIYIGNNKVIHYASPPDSNEDGVGLQEILGTVSDVNTIHEANIDRFELDGNPVYVGYEKDEIYPPLKVVARAASRLGENGYKLWSNNCEHFASWCKTASAESMQVNRLKAVGAAIVGGGLGLAANVVITTSLATVTMGASVAVGAVIGIISALCSKELKLAPVYEEFVRYASELYLGRTKAHPLGKSFQHSSQLKKNDLKVVLPKGKEDKLILFKYSGSWLFNEKKDWFITERSIVYPTANIYIDFHDVTRIYSDHFLLKIETIDKTYTFPSTFINSLSMAKFLNTSVAMTEMYESDFSISIFSRIKEMFILALGGIVVFFLTAYFLPVLAPWVAILMILIIFISPFLDKNENIVKENKN